MLEWKRERMSAHMAIRFVDKSHGGHCSGVATRPKCVFGQASERRVPSRNASADGRRRRGVLFPPLIGIGLLLLVGLIHRPETTEAASLHSEKVRATVADMDDEYQVLDHVTKCVPINIPLCRGLQYNQTMYPNLLKHPSQEEAAAEIKQYEMLVNVQCSPDFKFFLCTMFAPVCTMLPFPIPPCRHLCQSAKLGCDNLMQKFGYSWPEIFNCDQFPEFGTKDTICVGENRTDAETSTKSSSSSLDKAVPSVRNHFECPHTMKVLGRTRNTLLIANTTIEQCSMPCQNDGIVPTFFNAQIRHYLKLWTGAWAVICCICMLFTIVTFLIDLERFEFPERAILYMSLCYFVVSATYMVGLVAEDNLSCSGMSATKTPLVTQGIDNFACTATAVAHYFFTTAGIIWWVILCFSWFLVTTLKWGEAPVEHVFLSYFNIIAWFVPALMVIAILVTNSVDGDVFTGICSVGNLQPSVLFNFVVVPQAILIAIGLLLFACGFVSILRILSYIRGQQLSKFESTNGAAATEKVRTLMCRISSFTIFYIVPLIIGELCTYYQAVNMENWLTSWYSTRCLHAQRGAFGFTQSREFCPIYSERSGGMTLPVGGNHETPEPILFFVKYMSYFTVGIACAIWTVNGKTFSSYGDFYVKVVYGRSRVPTRVH